MNCIFKDCISLNTINANDRSDMVSCCSSLESKDITSLSTYNISNLSYIFDGCESKNKKIFK